MPPARSLRYWILTGLATLWLALLALPSAGGISAAAAPWVYLFFSKVCHQIADRSFFLEGMQLAVCHRCTGIYLGFWSGLLILPFWRQLASLLLGRPRIMLLFFLPMAVNVVLDNTTWGRFSTGFLAGFPVSIFVWNALEQLTSVRGHFARRSYESG